MYERSASPSITLTHLSQGEGGGEDERGGEGGREEREKWEKRGERREGREGAGLELSQRCGREQVLAGGDARPSDDYKQRRHLTPRFG